MDEYHDNSDDLLNDNDDSPNDNDDSPNDDNDSQDDETQINQGKIIDIRIPYQTGSIILMNHPASLCLYKYVSVQVLSGSVSINGCTMSRGDEFKCKVFSSEKTDILEVKTEFYEALFHKKSPESELINDFLKLVGNQETCKRLYDQILRYTVVLYIQRCAYPPAIEFVKFYYPQAFAFNLFKDTSSNTTYYFSKKAKSCLQFSKELEEAACTVANAISNARGCGEKYPRILVFGPRNSGKSTLLKYLINKMLSLFASVYYLDTDPGQPEFTPPGVVSLTELNLPILGPPFFHQKKESKMVFTGDISPSFIDMYDKSVKSLRDMYYQGKPAPLFVNTMGWLEGTGLHRLVNTIIAVKPTILIEIVVNNEAVMLDYRSYLPEEPVYIQIPCRHEVEKMTTLSPKEKRELSLLSHFGRCQLPYLRPRPINHFTPYCVSWKKIAIFIFPERSCPQFRIAQALNGSIVALCSVPENCIIPSDNADFPLTLVTDPSNLCLAYGLVQAIDETHELLIIISPLTAAELKDVNAIMKGNIMVPDVLFLKQEIYNVELPYVNVVEKILNEEDEMDVSKVSLKYLSESENETFELKPSSSRSYYSPAENFRKPVAKRYGHNFSRNGMK